MKTYRYPLHAVTGLAMLAVSAAASAAIVTSGDFKTGSPTPTLAISADIEILITITGSAGAMVFDEWVSSDAETTVLMVDPQTEISYKINHGVTQTVPVHGLVDNYYEATGNVLTDNDGYLFFTGIPVNAGDVLTILGGQSITFAANPTSNDLPASFTGNVGILNLADDAISGWVAVPEPSAALLGAVGVLALLRRRR